MSRTKAAPRTLSFGLEAYRADHNLYPDDVPARFFKAGMDYSQSCLRRLATPVGYVTTSYIPDTFSQEFPLVYVNVRAQVEQTPSVVDLLAPGLSAAQKAELVRHEYMLAGVGPDGIYHAQLVGDAPVLYGLSTRRDLSSLYDPTNGTISGGDIARTSLGAW